MCSTSRWIIGLAAGTAAASAQNLQWTFRTSGSPPPRAEHAMANDSFRGRTVLFGGTFGGPLGDTWEWDGTSWQNIAVPGPAPRAGHAMAFDSFRNRVVLFGGTNGNVPMNDTWLFDGAVWIPQIFAANPTPRSAHAMAFDSVRNRSILFGGEDAATALGDTWMWDGATWTQLAVSGPAARRRHAMVFDALRGRIVLFGGDGTNNAVFGDTWEWDGTVWALRDSAGPARFDHAMACDSLRGRTILHGGSLPNGALLYDTWEWNGATWLATPLTDPSARTQHAMVFDVQRRRAVMFGGNVVSDTWEYSRTATTTTFGTGCGSPALQLATDPVARPILGNTARATITNVPSSFSFVSIGLSRTAIGSFTLPLSLAGFGMPGCELLQSAESASVSTTPIVFGTAQLNMPLPFLPQFLGAHLYLQAWAPAPGANAGQTVVSNALDWLLGNV